MSRNATLLVLALLLGLAALLALRGCGDADADGADLPDAAAGATTAGAGDARADADAEALARAEHLERYATAMRAAVSTLHRYLAALPGEDRAAADAFWAGGQPPGDADEADLRALPAVPSSLRTRNRNPEALDRAPVPEAVRIPVELRLGLEGQPTRRYEGWYELRRVPGGDEWQITNASIDALPPPQ
ncbi:hypothetical protein FQY83_14485 [Luteimonas marina]|uniref:Nuclear transport factor 2 family protein n=1 Tax=Luteimonas marina TaxID=488485 RepID=A0A5C5TWK8_9GAMM|nr:hypothetical protein [Luteimonas marina]TWT18581.1 hypothetical protein FQY83_14485 [Luteimonas marina]